MKRFYLCKFLVSFPMIENARNWIVEDMLFLGVINENLCKKREKIIIILNREFNNRKKLYNF